MYDVKTDLEQSRHGDASDVKYDLTALVTYV